MGPPTRKSSESSAWRCALCVLPAVPTCAAPSSNSSAFCSGDCVCPPVCERPMVLPCHCYKRCGAECWLQLRLPSYRVPKKEFVNFDNPCLEFMSVCLSRRRVRVAPPGLGQGQLFLWEREALPPVGNERSTACVWSRRRCFVTAALRRMEPRSSSLCRLLTALPGSALSAGLCRWCWQREGGSEM